MEVTYIVFMFLTIIFLLIIIAITCNLKKEVNEIKKNIQNKQTCANGNRGATGPQGPKVDTDDAIKGGLCWNCIYGYNQLFYKHEDEYYPDKKTCENVDCDMFCRDISPETGCMRGYVDAKKNLLSHSPGIGPGWTSDLSE